ncbi:hypothetical protein KGM_206066 [Danaus plexippus plexippus]|uniref:Uncharacterized protein n=1 Tax=Danaus plexippus plexippus TaxID=278856 RepID=A0A212EJN2_DANPL|nr:hypothetical protein KGM_206066 [Danaus plexippus plexippus]
MSTIGSPGKGGGGVPTTDSGCQPPRATQGHSLSVKVIATPARYTRHPRFSVTTNRPTHSGNLCTARTHLNTYHKRARHDHNLFHIA